MKSGKIINDFLHLGLFLTAVSPLVTGLSLLNLHELYNLVRKNFNMSSMKIKVQFQKRRFKTSKIPYNRSFER